MEVTPLDIQNVFQTVHRLLRIGGALAAVTPTQLDDKALETINTVLDAVEPVAHEEWFPEVLNLILSLFTKGKDPQVIISTLKAAVAS